MSVKFNRSSIQIFLFILLFLLFFQCSHNSNSPFWLEDENPKLPFVQILPGEAESFTEYDSRDYLPEFWEIKEGVCLRSRGFAAVDSSPVLEVCLPAGKEIQNQWKSLKKALTKSSENESFPSLEWGIDSGTVLLDFYRESSLFSKEKNLVWNEKVTLDERIRMGLGFPESVRVGNKSLWFPQYLSLPSWNWLSGGECMFLFSTWDLEVPLNQRRVLRIRVPCSPFRRLMKDGLVGVENWETESCLEERPEIQVTERFFHTQSRFRRFIELTNISDQTICPIRIEWEGSRSGAIEWNNTSILPGGKILLGEQGSRYESFYLPGDFPWTDWNRGNVQIYIYTAKERSEPITCCDPVPDHFSSFHFESEFFSFESNPRPCGESGHPYHLGEKFCGSPGVDNPREIQIREGRKGGNSQRQNINLESNLVGIRKSETSFEETKFTYCKPQDLYLTEINAMGVPDPEGNFDTRDRYLEFENRGPECDISSIWMEIGTEKIPLSAVRKIIRSNRPYLISLTQKIPNKEIVLPRNLFRLGYAQGITAHSLEPNIGSQELKPSTGFEFIPFSPEGNFYSLEVKREGGIFTYSHHPRRGFSIWSQFRGGQGSLFMSPGTKSNPEQRVGGNTESKRNEEPLRQSFPLISEIHWAGSYEGNTSVLSDRFLEWEEIDLGSLGGHQGFFDSGGFDFLNSDTLSKIPQNSFYLILDWPGFPNRYREFLIPRLGPGLHLISAGPLRCFPGSESLVHRNFALFNNNVDIQIRDTNRVLLDHIFFRTQDGGRNLTSQRLRSSAYRNLSKNEIHQILSKYLSQYSPYPDEHSFSGIGEWKTSQNPSPICGFGSSATPGEKELVIGND